jgi:phytoene dehydrogenase-like protein
MAQVIVVGAGHNGLVASILLARAGLEVTVLEERSIVGGASRTEYPFKRAPKLGSSTGAYLLGLMPPELMAQLGLDVPLLRRDPHYFLPTTGRGYLLFGSDHGDLHRQFLDFFSEADWTANQRLSNELSQIREDLAPSWLLPPLSLEETAERFVRQPLRDGFIDLCRGSAREFLERFGFKSDLLKAMYAVTDAFSGLDGGYDTPGTGMNLLVHNMCRLPGSDGTWMLVKGGMGTVTAGLAERAQAAGVRIRTGARVDSVLVEAGAISGVALAGGEQLRSEVVLCNADPFAAVKLLPHGALPFEYLQQIEKLRSDGSTLKVNLCLEAFPKFSCLPAGRSPGGATIHLLPDEESVLSDLERAYRQMKSGRLPEFPAIEWYNHTGADDSLRDEQGRHSSALFVQWVPYSLAKSSWPEEEDRYVRHLLSICDRFAPGTSDSVREVFTLTPPKIEKHFGISRGHIHHVDNKFGFDQRAPYESPIQGFYLCGAGCHPAGSVIGAAGHNAAQSVLRDLGARASN